MRYISNLSSNTCDQCHLSFPGAIIWPKTVFYRLGRHFLVIGWFS